MIGEGIDATVGESQEKHDSQERKERQERKQERQAEQEGQERMRPLPPHNSGSVHAMGRGVFDLRRHYPGMW
jgi:putative component of toxin-antitoxin plasmid stabilization module